MFSLFADVGRNREIGGLYFMSTPNFVDSDERKP
jgi:hypothetical protein